MQTFISKKLLPVLVIFATIYLGVKYILPVVFPFLLGAGIAFLAEPLARLVNKRTGRVLASGLAVTLALAVLSGTVLLLGAIAVQQLGRLSPNVPRLAATAQQSMDTLKVWLSDLSVKAPAPLGPALKNTVNDFFADSSGLFSQLASRIPGVITTVIGTLSSGILSLGVAVVSAYLISCRLPQIKKYFSEQAWFSSVSSVLSRILSALGGWLKAQLKLCTVTWGIVSIGFLLMNIPNGILWALVVAIIDAIPVLGTGTVLVPWAVVCLLQKESLRAIGLLAIYGASAMTRTVLEPKLLGSGLGLDPLITLIALYIGFRFWGFPGLFLTPIVASAVKSLLTSQKYDEKTS